MAIEEADNSKSESLMKLNQKFSTTNIQAYDANPYTNPSTAQKETSATQRKFMKTNSSTSSTKQPNSLLSSSNLESTGNSRFLNPYLNANTT